MNRRSFLADSLSILTTRVFMLVVALLTSVLLARLLGADGKGTFTTLLVYTGLVVSLAEMGIRQATVFQIGSKAHGEDAVVETVLFMLVVSSALGMVVIWLIYSVLDSDHLGAVMVALVCALVPVQLTSKYMSGILLGKQEIARFNRVSWMPPVANVAFIVAFVWLLDWGVVGALLALLLANGIVSIYSLVLTTRGTSRRIRVHGTVVVEMVKLGAMYAAAFFVFLLNYRIGIVMLERMASIGDVGRYALAVSIAELIWQVPAVVGAVVFTRSSAAKERDVFTTKVASVFRVSLLVGAAAAAVLTVLAPSLIGVVFGADFESSGTILIVLLPGVVAMIAQKVLNMDLAGQGKPHAGVLIFLASAVLNAILCLLLIPHYNVYGAAFSSTISYVFAAVGFLVLYSKLVDVRVLDILSYRRSDFAFLQPLLSNVWRR